MQGEESMAVVVAMCTRCSTTVRGGDNTIPLHEWQRPAMHIAWLQKQTHCAICQKEVSPGKRAPLIIDWNGLIWAYEPGVRF